MKAKWHRVTNELICSLAVKGCPNCDGNGYTGTKFTPTGICSCATLTFRREYDGRVRRRSQRIGVRDVSWLEFTDCRHGILRGEQYDVEGRAMSECAGCGQLVERHDGEAVG